jgi:hypothetical protein
MTWALLLGAWTPDSLAMFIPSGFSQAQANPVSEDLSDLKKIQVVLESKLIAQRLSDLGFTVEEVQARLSQLPGHQIHQIAQQLDGLQIGGDGLGIVIALLVIAILVVILLQITGHKIIVTK